MPPPPSPCGEQVRLPLRSPCSIGVVACVGYRVAGPVLGSRWPGALVLAACGGDDDDDASSSGSRRRRRRRPRTSAPPTPTSPRAWPRSRPSSRGDRGRGRGRRRTRPGSSTPRSSRRGSRSRARSRRTTRTRTSRSKTTSRVLGNAVDEQGRGQGAAGGRHRSPRPPTRTWSSTPGDPTACAACALVCARSAAGARHVGVARAAGVGHARGHRAVGVEGRSDPAARHGARVDRPHARADQGRPDGAGVRGGEGRLPQPLRVRRDPAARRRRPAHLRRRDEVRRDPRADQLAARPTARSATNIVELRGADRRRRTPAHRHRASARRRSCSASRSSSSSARVSKPSCSSRCCSATSRRPRRRSTGARSCGAWASPRSRPSPRSSSCAPCSTALPVGREVLEAITALLAVAVLFYVSFWLIARLEQKRWLEFLRARVWSAVSVGSTAALVLVGFTAVYREGFETALFYQALLSFGSGPRRVGRWPGSSPGIVALAVVSWVIFRLGRAVPLKTFLSAAVVLLMATSVAFLGNAVRSLQEADVIALHRWPGLAACADLPVAVARLLAEPRDDHRPARAARGLRARRVVHVRAPAAAATGRTPPPARRAPATRGRAPSRRRSSTRTAEPWRSGSASTSAGRSRKPSRSTSTRGAVVADAIVPTTHDHADGVAAGVVDVVARARREVGPRPHRARHPLDHPGRQRAARRRRRRGRHDRHGPGARPAQGPQAHDRSAHRAERRPHARHGDGVPRRHRAASTPDDARRRSSRACARRAPRRSRSPRRSRPTTSPTKSTIGAAAAELGPAGDDVGRAHRPLRARAARRSPPRSTRRSCRSRCAPPRSSARASPRPASRAR